MSANKLFNGVSALTLFQNYTQNSLTISVAHSGEIHLNEEAVKMYQDFHKIEQRTGKFPSYLLVSRTSQPFVIVPTLSVSSPVPEEVTVASQSKNFQLVFNLKIQMFPNKENREKVLIRLMYQNFISNLDVQVEEEEEEELEEPSDEEKEEDVNKDPEANKCLFNPCNPKTIRHHREKTEEEKEIKQELRFKGKKRFQLKLDKEMRNKFLVEYEGKSIKPLRLFFMILLWSLAVLGPAQDLSTSSESNATPFIIVRYAVLVPSMFALLLPTLIPKLVKPLIVWQQALWMTFGIIMALAEISKCISIEIQYF